MSTLPATGTTTAVPPGTTIARIPAPLLNGIGALLLLALAVWLWVGAGAIEGAGNGVSAPDGFPRLVAALLGASCLALLVQAVQGALARSAAVVTVPRPLPVLLALVLVCAYPPLIGALGYYAATALWMVPFLLLAGMRRPMGIVASVAGFLLFTKVLFQMILGTPLP